MLILQIVGSMIAGYLGVICIVHPWFIHRGLSQIEYKGHWPGDEAVPRSEASGSRAIIVHASSERVWPWLTQIGQDRGGFYSYRWLENIFGAKMPDVRQIIPRWSIREMGQALVMAPVERIGPVATMEIVHAEVGRRLTYRNTEGVWSFIIQPLGQDECRLICRGTWKPSKSAFVRMARFFVFDPIHYLMEWKMIRTIRSLAEKDSH